MEMGFAPALTNESWRLRPVAEPKSGPVVMSTSSKSKSTAVALWGGSQAVAGLLLK
jgi:hypothetical protein